MAEQKRHMDVPKERFLERLPQTGTPRNQHTNSTEANAET